jgi:enoyl-CoA hydratase/carnithine racemase
VDEDVDGDRPAARTVEDVGPLPWLRVQRDDSDPAVVVVTLDDPDRRNAMTLAMTGSWERLVPALAGDGSVRAVVLTGSGSAFSSGGDLSWLGDDTGPGAPVEVLRTRMSRYYEAWLGLRAVEVPVVAAVNGPAVGAGVGLLLACDLRVCARSAHLSVPFSALGLHPGMGLTHSLVAAVGLTVAQDLLLTGRRMGAEEAARTGLVTSVVDDGEALEAALGLARTVAARAPVATRLTVAALRSGGHPDLASALRWEALAQSVTLATADAAEGLRAAADRRAPRFTGR